MFTRSVHQVDEVVEGRACSFESGRLTLNLDELTDAARRIPRITDVHLALVRPGDRVRVVGVLDIFDARWSETGPTYPGLDGPPGTAGTRTTHLLANFQIVGCTNTLHVTCCK